MEPSPLVPLLCCLLSNTAYGANVEYCAPLNATKRPSTWSGTARCTVRKSGTTKKTISKNSEFECRGDATQPGGIALHALAGSPGCSVVDGRCQQRAIMRVQMSCWAHRAEESQAQALGQWMRDCRFLPQSNAPRPQTLSRNDDNHGVRLHSVLQPARHLLRYVWQATGKMRQVVHEVHAGPLHLPCAFQ